MEKEELSQDSTSCQH